MKNSSMFCCISVATFAAAVVPRSCANEAMNILL